MIYAIHEDWSPSGIISALADLYGELMYSEYMVISDEHLVVLAAGGLLFREISDVLDLLDRKDLDAYGKLDFDTQYLTSIAIQVLYSLLDAKPKDAVRFCEQHMDEVACDGAVYHGSASEVIATLQEIFSTIQEEMVAVPPITGPTILMPSRN